MVDNETIDSYLIQMNRPAELLGEGIWRVDDETDDVPPVLVSHAPPIVSVRLKVMDVPEHKREAVFEKLLRLNAADVAFGAYAIDGNEVVLIDTLRSDSLSMEELQASLESLILAVTEHYRGLHDLLSGEE